MEGLPRAPDGAGEARDLPGARRAEPHLLARLSAVYSGTERRGARSAHLEVPRPRGTVQEVLRVALLVSAIFAAALIAIVADWIDRTTTALLGAAAVMLVGAVSADGAARLSRGRPLRLLLLIGLLSGVMSASLDNLTAIPHVLPMAFAVSCQLGISPIPLAITQILASNLGGTATLIGDPPHCGPRRARPDPAHRLRPQRPARGACRGRAVRGDGDAARHRRPDREGARVGRVG
ncbi:MAG: hypothetical protein FJW81_00005, partial [Actinobacteria bacterium]|nr:hypothetical protein [Actinomycetota bacterium]